MEHFLGGEKNIFLIRDIDDATIMAGASAESCRFVVLRSPWGRLGSVLDVRNRLRRHFQCKIHLPRSFALYLCLA